MRTSRSYRVAVAALSVVVATTATVPSALADAVLNRAAPRAAPPRPAMPPHLGPVGFRGGPGLRGPHEVGGRGFARYEFRGRDVRRFGPHDFALWRGGRWHQAWHDGRYGWWWLAGGAWYFYDRPVYPYPVVVSDIVGGEPVAAEPAPPWATQMTGPPPAESWYFCDSPHGYYPYVRSCPTGFRAVPAGRR